MKLICLDFLLQSAIDSGIRIKTLLKGIESILVSRIQKCNSSILRSNTFFYEKRVELEALFDQDGISTFLFAFLASDDHW